LKQFALLAKTMKDIEKKFMAPELTGTMPVRIEAVKSGGLKLAQSIERNCPASRERALAMTNLEQCILWAVEAIARNG
jgi:hypothetical protein